MDNTERRVDTLAQIYCSGYVFHLSDGSRFCRRDVEPVVTDQTNTGLTSRLYVTPREVGVKRKRRRVSEDTTSDRDSMVFDFHICSDESSSSTTDRFVVANKCTAWHRLSDTQRGVLEKIQERLDSDRNGGRHFTCAIIEGPGGCGKTRIMSHVMNHKPLDTLTLYITKQNKRVQDFIHTDCLNGEQDPTVQKPVDLTPKNSHEILSLLFSPTSVGRFALTAEKLVYAIAGLSPRKFHRNVSASQLCIKYDVFSGHTRCTNSGQSPDTQEKKAVGPGRKIIIMIDEYTMLQPPLIHTIAYYVRQLSPQSPLLLVMGGDKLQCGPVGWSDSAEEVPTDEQRYTTDIRRETVRKMKYDILDMKMENLERCRGDRALGGCVKRLRRVCEEKKNTRFPTRLINLVLAKYSVESGVTLYRKEIEASGAVRIRKVVPADPAALDFDGHGDRPTTDLDQLDFDEYVRDLENEELDERGVELKYSLDPPVGPMYDLKPLVVHFTDLYTRLATVLIENGKRTGELWPQIVYGSVVAIRHLFPAFIVLTNTSCNKFAEMFLLALSTKVRERVLDAPVPADTTGRLIPADTWVGHLEYTMRRCIRSITIDERNAIHRQTLFVGMLYKMTSTFNTDPTCYLCNGEVIILTSLVFDNNSLDKINAVTLRKLDRDADTDLTLRTGQNQNRMTDNRKMDIMPFVPHVSENIYQTQGNTMPVNAKAFVDVTAASSNNVYVAVSRFQNSASISGIVISE